MAVKPSDLKVVEIHGSRAAAGPSGPWLCAKIHRLNPETSFTEQRHPGILGVLDP
jgi:hypothetical protein